jgi:glycosyltransferase involved in cell wall biosynthesis
MARTVSIVIPTFNRSALLVRAIDSALAQTVPVEVVVCDHGSTDDTLTVAARYGARINYIRRERDQGPIICWRDGIEQAAGECIHINYDDDWTAPTFVEKTLPLLQGSVGFVYTRATLHGADLRELKTLHRHPPGTHPMAGVVQYLLREKLTISPGCALFRKRDLLKNLLSEVPGASGAYGRNSGVGEDLLLFLLTALDYQHYAHLPEALAHFLAHPASITTSAGNNGNMGALVDAYAVAKEHYLRQPGHIPRRRGIPARIERLIWNLAGRVRP